MNMNVTGLPSGLNTPAPEPAKSSLDGDGFLTLLMAQLAHQDPTSPVETTQFMQQLTSLNTVQQLVTANESLQGLMTAMTSISNENAVNLVGKEVTAISNSFSLAEGETETLEFDLPEGASEVTVTIYDEGGIPVGSVERRDMDAGPQTVTWSGDRDSGAGDYTFKVEAKDADGDAMPPITTYATGLVSEIRFDAGFPVLVIDGRHISLSDVITVRPGPEPEPETDPESTPHTTQSQPLATRVTPE